MLTGRLSKSELEARAFPPPSRIYSGLRQERNWIMPPCIKGSADWCDSYQERLNLCGLSLGGLLALDYAVRHPENINSLVLIGTLYDIPKRLLRLQNLVFQLMPKSTFQNMGISKKDFIHLSHSMIDLDFMRSAGAVGLPPLLSFAAQRTKRIWRVQRGFHEGDEKQQPWLLWKIPVTK